MIPLQPLTEQNFGATVDAEGTSVGPADADVDASGTGVVLPTLL